MKQLDMNPMNKKEEVQKYNPLYDEIPNYFNNKKCGQYSNHVGNAFCHFIVGDDGDLIAYSLDNNSCLCCQMP